MTRDIQEMTDASEVCQKHQRSNVKHTVISKEIPSLPFERVATDLFHFRGREFILLVDSYSSYFDFKKLANTSSRTIIQQLKEWFAVHGIPRVLESDNGPQYSSQEFIEFSKEWCFDHSTSSPNFPRANGLAERFVQTAKALLKKCAEDKTDLQLALLHSRNTPRSADLPSSCKRLMGHLLRSNLPCTKMSLQPRPVSRVSTALNEEREHQKQYADRRAVESKRYNQEDSIMLQNHETKTWTPATILKCTDGRRSYVVTNG
ncbi:uncharacterized protein K02A2.6-like [Uranotaenia lowii]|uniref:uncharacterized protein K02A2.6-like n=1 Tax=Uranotaenia lowii TaxID=190385 RepID=UPI00247837F1|nr:uncharacterized protein K02A2.6-like [Uranotaenia lowii]